MWESQFPVNPLQWKTSSSSSVYSVVDLIPSPPARENKECTPHAFHRNLYIRYTAKTNKFENEASYQVLICDI